ncbi:MAG: serine/threonine-protein kinase [Planctomycetota bacterium]
MSALAWGQLDAGILDDLFEADSLGLDLGDRYELGAVLGEGGQGVVYQAQDRSCNRQVAVKCARYSGSSIRAEAELLARLAHPAIPQVYDLGTSLDGRDFVAMQLLIGERLDQWLEREPGLDDRLRVFVRIAEGIEHAHRRGILHRDLKPTNIIVDGTDRDPVILDWGLAAEGGRRSICGSPHFAAPEQLQSQPVDARADVYALGVLLYWLISGDLPYARRVSDFHEFRRVQGGIRLLPLRKRAPAAPRAIERLVQRCMAPQPAGRPGSVQQVIDAVRAVRDALRSSARRRRHWPPLLAALLAGVLIGVWTVQRWWLPSADADPLIEAIRAEIHRSARNGGLDEDGAAVDPLVEAIRAEIQRHVEGDAQEPGSETGPERAGDVDAADESDAEPERTDDPGTSLLDQLRHGSTIAPEAGTAAQTPESSPP